MCFTNDLKPRAIHLDGSLKAAGDWTLIPTLVRRGAALGANATLVCGITIGAWAVVGAGSVVTRDVPDYGLVYGNPARLHGFACPCGSKLKMEQTEGETVTARCTECGQGVQIPLREWEQAG